MSHSLHCSPASYPSMCSFAELWLKTVLVPASICQTRYKPARILHCHTVQLIAVGVPQQQLMSLTRAEEGPKSKRVLVPPVEAAAVKPDLTAAKCPSRPDPHERQGYGALRCMQSHQSCSALLYTSLLRSHGRRIQTQLSAVFRVLHGWQGNMCCTVLLLGLKSDLDLQLLHCSPPHPKLSGRGTASIDATACGTNRRASGLCR